MACCFEHMLFSILKNVHEQKSDLVNRLCGLKR